VPFSYLRRELFGKQSDTPRRYAAACGAGFLNSVFFCAIFCNLGPGGFAGAAQPGRDAERHSNFRHDLEHGLLEPVLLRAAELATGLQEPAEYA